MLLQVEEAQAATREAEEEVETTRQELEALRRQLSESEDEMGVLRSSAERAATQAARRVEELEQRTAVSVTCLNLVITYDISVHGRGCHLGLFLNHTRFVICRALNTRKEGKCVCVL
jgi:hypothetical protein